MISAVSREVSDEEPRESESEVRQRTGSIPMKTSPCG